MGLFGKRKDAPRDYSQMSAEEALKLAREGLAKTGTYFNSSGQRRKLGDEQRAQMDAMFDKLEAAQAKSSATPAQAGDDRVSQLERLVALRDSGALTEEEFVREKARILGSSA